MTEPSIAIESWLDPPQAAAHAAPRTGPRAAERREPVRVLLLATLRWPLAARLALAFAEQGCHVEAWCPSGHPVARVRALARRHPRRALAPLRSLRRALGKSAPDLLVPCDDAAALELEALHRDGLARDADARWRELIERSLGTPASCRVAATRAALMRLAAREGVRVPEHAEVDSEPELLAFCARHGFPVVLKSDDSWGGLGVHVVQDAGEARAAFRRASRERALPALSQLLLRRDGSRLLRWASGRRPALSVQRHVSGVPANSALACWRGQILAAIDVAALRTLTPTGPASVVRRIDHPEMAEAGRRLMRALGLSGLCGLDFMIEAATGRAYLIELNPRATPIAHLALGPGRDLPRALRAAVRGEPVPATTERVPDGIIAMFPGELRRNPLSAYLQAAHHDVPWSEPALVRDCLDLPWEERGVLARLRARLWRRPSAAGPAEPLLARDATLAGVPRDR